MKKQTMKKIAAITLSAVGLSALSFGAAGCVAKSTGTKEPDNIEITRLAPPTDGSLPTAHTCAENLAYINYVFDGQEQYHSYCYGITAASIVTQTTRTFRDYKDGILLTTDLTYSSMVKSGTQTCTVTNAEGESEVYLRTSGAPEADTLPSQATWSEEAPVIFNERSYHYTYGLLPTELFNYIINDQTIIDSEAVKVNADGTYTQSFTLDPVASTYFYQYGMKTRGGLSGYPDFENISFSVTFDGDWRILSSDVHEVSKINKGVVLNSISDFTTQYFYGEEKFDGVHYSYYDGYFKQYIGDSSLESGGSVDEKPVIDVTNVLSNGFSQIMNGGAQYQITAQLGKNTYTGYVFISLDLANPLETLALKVSLGKSLKEQGLFLEYADGKMNAYCGKGFALTANVAEVKLALGQFEDIINGIKAAFTVPEQPAPIPEEGGAADGEESDMLAALMQAMVITAGEKQAVITLNSDDLLGLGLGVDLRLVFGITGNEITFRGGTVGGLALGGEAIDLNLTVVTTTAPVISMPEAGDCADLSDYIADVHSLLGADLLKLSLSLHGSDESVKISGLKGIELDVDSYVDLDGFTVGADVAVSYTYLGRRISAEVSAWYDYNAANGDMGQAVLQLNALNGTPCDIKIKCDVSELYDALKTLITFGGEGSGTAANGLVSIINGALSADISSIITELSANGQSIKAGVSIDALLEMFNVDAGVKFGSCALTYTKGGGVYGGDLSASLPALGFNMSICGADGAVSRPDLDGCLDLNKLVNTISSAWEQVDGIIKAESLAFEIARGETYLSLDGILVEIWGEGEISWKKGGEYVALDLYAAITEKASDVIAVKLIYNKNAENAPLVRLALNGVGIDIYKEDIDGVVNGFNEIYKKLAPLFGSSGESGNAQGAALTQSGNENGTDKLLGLLFDVLSGNGWVEELNKLTLTTDGKSVALSYISQFTSYVELRVDGALELQYRGDTGNRFSLGGGLAVNADTGRLVSSIEGKLESCKMSSSREEGSAAFIRLAYDYLFEAVDAIGVENILGSNTYTVAFSLLGDNCNIEALEGVKVDARIYVTGEKGEQGKLAEGDLDVDVAGVAVKLNVITERRGDNTRFYINLMQVADVKLPDLKFMATQDSLYETFAILLKTINNTNILDFVGSLMADGGNKTPAEAPVNGASDGAQPVIADSTVDALCDLLSKLLDFNFSQAVVGVEVDGVLTATIDLDNIAKQLGWQTGALGTVEAVINHDSHSMKTSGKTLVTDADGKTQLKEWISLSSELAPRRDYAGFERSDYISIEFLPALIDDLVKTVTDENGAVYNKFTLSGSVTAKLVGMLNVEIDNLTVTAGFGENGLALNAVMHVKQTKVLGMGISEGTLGFTYQNGMLTLARGLNTPTPEAKVMTFDYFMDHMLVKDGSVLQWWLDVSGWSLVMSFVNVDINSGLTTPQNVYLYNAAASKDEQEISMYDYVEALRVIIDGNQTAVFGDYTALENDLGVTDNYYGFALNAGAVTGGVLTKLNAAITRNVRGIDAIKASGAIQSYVTFSADLQYKEGLDNEYVFGTALGAGVTAPSMYDFALGLADDYGYNPDFGHYDKNPAAGYDEKFGCMSITSGNNGYEFVTDYSKLLYTHVLTVIGLDGKAETRDVRHGSTVYMYDNNSPVYTDSGKSMRLLYTLTNGAVGGTSFVMDGDTTVYAMQSKAVTVFVHNGEEVIEVSSFVGDKVPTAVAGLETLSAPVYADGAPVGENDRVGNVNSLHIYGTFAQSEVIINYVKYAFNPETLTYAAVGKAAGFNDYYSVKGNTLVLENVIGGYPVTAIGANAFANTEGKPISSVVVPENIVTVGENAFLDNVDMQSAMFLAENVEFLGKDGSSKTMPFYGCSVSSDDEKTALKVYYNNITASGGNWKHFRYVSKVFSFNFYIGDNGGATYGAGSWQFVDYRVNIELGGVTGSTLTEQAVCDILAPYFPTVVTGGFAGSASEAQIAGALEAALTQFEITRGGIIYTCAYTAEIEENGNRLTVTYNVSYKRAAQVYVKSALDFTLYGSEIKANTLTQLLVPVDGEEIKLASPAALATHNFAGWTVTEENGATVYNAQWTAKEFKLKIRLTRGGTDTSIVHIDSNTYRVNGSGIKGTADVTELIIYGGEATFTITDKVLTIVTGDVTYTVYVNEASVFGSDKNNKRNINSDVNGTLVVSGDMTLTLVY